MMGMEVKKNNVLSLIVLFIATTLVSAAQNLSFIEPIIPPNVHGVALPYYTAGDEVTISWVTPFEKTTLLVYQLRDDQNWAYGILAVNYPKSNTTFIWKAHGVESTPLNNKHPFKFVLENGQSYACANCVLYSPKFLVKEDKKKHAAATTAGSQGKPTTATSSPSTSATHANAAHSSRPTAGVAAAEGGHGTSSTLTSSSSGSHSHLGIGLGVGLGIGIPVLIALLVLLLFLRRRRRQQQRISFHPTGSGNWATEQTGMREAGDRESGALGPWSGEPDRMSQRSGLSEGSVHVRPSYAQSGSGMSRMSHRSWIEDFEFEKPMYRDQDAMSQLRNSIHSSTHLGDDIQSNGIGVVDGGDSTPRGSSSRGDAPLIQQPQSMYFTPSSTPTPSVPRKPVPITNFGNTDLSSLEGIPEQMQSSPLRPQRRSRGDGRDWPLP